MRDGRIVVVIVPKPHWHNPPASVAEGYYEELHISRRPGRYWAYLFLTYPDGNTLWWEWGLNREGEAFGKSGRELAGPEYGVSEAGFRNVRELLETWSNVLLISDQESVPTLERACRELGIHLTLRSYVTEYTCHQTAAEP